MKSIKVLFSVIAICAVSILYAQKKSITLEQLVNRDVKDYYQSIPFISPNSWLDNTHFKLADMMNSRNNTIIDATTGEVAVNYKEPQAPVSAGAVTITKGDIYYQKQLLKATPEEEKAAMLSPDGKTIAFVRNSDLYLWDIATGKETRLTNDGTETIYNGLSSWVYNEEILGRKMNYRAYWWSPDSKRIVFMHTNDTEVPVYNVFNDLDGEHGSNTRVHYPLPGDKNPDVRIGVVDLAASAPKITWADFNEKNDQYFAEPVWTPDGNTLLVQWMNRRQDSLVVYKIDLNTGAKAPYYTEVQKTWVDNDMDNRFTFLPDGKEFILLSDKSGWMHMYLHNTTTGKEIKQLTSGNWQVTEINYLDKKGWIYFTARKENSTRFDLYKIKKDGTGMKRLTFGDYTHRFISLSPDGSYFVTTYSNAATPARIALVNNEGKIIKEIANSKGPNFDQYDVGRSEIFTVPSSDGLFQLPVRVVWPANFNPSKKYAVKVNIYGGPNRSNVQDGFYTYGVGLGDWLQQEDLIQLTMDHRGSGQFGKIGMDYLYGNLGKWELEDYMTVIKWMENKYPCIDPKRVMITGFSYGGYMTSLALTKGADVFTHGIAGGSVIDWRLYDNVYTERYMGRPQDNPEGYKNANVLSYVKNYKGLLRIEQGTIDDNVHMQNSILLVNALQDEGKRFEFMLYPGCAHGWAFNQKKQNHSSNEATWFLYKNLLQKDPPEALIRKNRER